MSGFDTLWNIRTHRHIRTARSILKNTGSGRAAWPRLRETEWQRWEAERLQARRRLHERRRAR